MRLDGTDPSGAGINEQKVNNEGQALTFATTQSELEHESEENGAGYVWASDIVDVAAGNGTVLLVKNTSDTHLHIDNIHISNGAIASEYTIHLPTVEVTPAGTAVTGVNLNTTSSNVADAIAKSKETDNAQGNVIGTVWLAVDRDRNFLTPGLIIGKNKSIAIDVVVDTAESAVEITGHYEV